MENKSNTTVIGYTIERIDNATILTDEKQCLKVAALDADGGTAPPYGKLEQMLGNWIVEDLRDATDDFMTCKVKLTLNIKPINE